MLEAACDKAQSVVLDQVFFSLDEARFHQFTALLDAPPAHNAGLERHMAVQVLWLATKACACNLVRPSRLPALTF